MSYLKSTLDTIIRKSFHELMGEEIQIDYAESKKHPLCHGYIPKSGWYINVNEELSKAPPAVVEGGIAHELAHIATEKEYGRTMTRLGKLENISRRHKTAIERNTDVTVILRGYGPQLQSYFENIEMVW
jgi:hypothetical protein